jgi:hypothetical protein
MSRVLAHTVCRSLEVLIGVCVILAAGAIDSLGIL